MSAARAKSHIAGGTSGDSAIRITCIISAGRDSGDHRRVVTLMREIGADPDYVFVARGKAKLKQLPSLIRTLSASGDRLVFIEGTGVIPGIAAIIARRRSRGRLRYIVSSGDAVDTYIRNRHGAFAGWIARRYESSLYRNAFAFVGWTPYLVGRAIRMGASKGITVEGFVPDGFDDQPSNVTRADLGIPDDALVVAVTGSVNWSERQKYCYGLELVNAAPMIARSDVRFLIVGDGSGLERLRRGAAGDDRFIFTGRVPHSTMRSYVGLIDLAVIGQTDDELGALRLTTKLPEYLSAGLTVVMPAAPGVIDYLADADFPPVVLTEPAHPASVRFATDVAHVVEGTVREELARNAPDARRIAAERFAAPRVARRLRALLELARPRDPS